MEDSMTQPHVATDVEQLASRVEALEKLVEAFAAKLAAVKDSPVGRQVVSMLGLKDLDLG
jgi:hypothetical protein